MSLFQVTVARMPTRYDMALLAVALGINLVVIAAFAFVIAACVTAGIEVVL